LENATAAKKTPASDAKKHFLSFYTAGIMTNSFSHVIVWGEKSGPQGPERKRQNEALKDQNNIFLLREQSSWHVYAISPQTRAGQLHMSSPKRIKWYSETGGAPAHTGITRIVIIYDAETAACPQDRRFFCAAVRERSSQTGRHGSSQSFKTENTKMKRRYWNDSNPGGRKGFLPWAISLEAINQEMIRCEAIRHEDLKQQQLQK